MDESYSPSGVAGGGFDQLPWINNRNMKKKIPLTLGEFPALRRTKRKMMWIRGCFSRGFLQRFRENILSGPLVWGDASLSSDPWPLQGGMDRCEVFTCHRGKGGGEACQWARLALEFHGQICKMFGFVVLFIQINRHSSAVFLLAFWDFSISVSFNVVKLPLNLKETTSIFLLLQWPNNNNNNKNALITHFLAHLGVELNSFWCQCYFSIKHKQRMLSLA